MYYTVTTQHPLCSAKFLQFTLLFKDTGLTLIFLPDKPSTLY